MLNTTTVFIVHLKKYYTITFISNLLSKIINTLNVFNIILLKEILEAYSLSNFANRTCIKKLILIYRF